ncbi:MAG: MiaB/RimO family radical SAM methylthiotransferase [Patescibacteria group bacterium]|nr:MiaB/RimO family radical SAM methylthiotransferase [Patescibacteria group bacterium]
MKVINNKISNGVKDKKTYYIITIGCQMNKSDSERIAAYLESFGFKPAKNENSAGVVVLTTCGVRQSAEDRVYGLVGKIKKKNPKAKIILTGCLSQREDVRRRLADKVDIWLNISELANLDLRFKKKTKNCSYLKIRPKYSSNFSAFVPIGNGCDNFCSYCVVPYARGREIYRPAKEILGEIKDLVKNGYKEIILIAQNVNSYKSGLPIADCRLPNKSRRVNFAKLLKMVNDIPGNFWIRFATSHPKDMSDELIKIIAGSDKICQHIHLPAQAGDNKILSAMNRNYTRENYVKLVRKIRHVINSKFQNSNDKQISKLKTQNSKRDSGQMPVSMTTDVIVGFPGETKKQFANTVKLFKEIKFDMAYIARYSPRPGTAAYKLKDDVSSEEKKRREEELMKILRKTALENNKKYIGKTVKILVSGKNQKGEWHGYTATNKNVKYQSSNVKSGEFVKIKIIKARDFGLEGIVA